jgi:4,5-DOPA dioxygenase extradiol
MSLPALFVSHGAPTLSLTQTPVTDFLRRLGPSLPERPKAILVVSAHWETNTPEITASAVNATIHDFYGFPAELYALSYPAPGADWLTERVMSVLGQAGLPGQRDEARGLDHGAWVPLRLMYPDADIPVVQLSVQTARGPAYHLELGRILAPLREEGVLIIGSGSFTHDLSEFRHYYHQINAPEPDWVRDFADWTTSALTDGRQADLIAYRKQAPHGVKNHPTEEHFLPLFVAMGAGTGPVQHLHQSTTHGVLRMDVFAFGGLDHGV